MDVELYTFQHLNTERKGNKMEKFNEGEDA